MMLSGYWVQLRKVPLRVSRVRRSAEAWLDLARELEFIWIVLILYLVFDFPFSVGVATAIGWTVLTEHISWAGIKKYLKRGLSLDTTVLIFGIMYFKSAIEVSGLVSSVVEWFISLGVPLLIPAILLPLLVGLVTGTYAGAMALAFAFLAGGVQSVFFWVAINILTRMGCLFSPVNASRLLTINFFSGDDKKLLLKVLQSLLPAATLTIVYLVIAMRGAPCS